MSAEGPAPNFAKPVFTASVFYISANSLLPPVLIIHSLPQLKKPPIMIHARAPINHFKGLYRGLGPYIRLSYSWRRPEEPLTRYDWSIALSGDSGLHGRSGVLVLVPVVSNLCYF